MEQKRNIKTEYPSENITVKDIFLHAIDHARKTRAENPDQFPNTVLALQSVLLPKERKYIEDYITDYKPYIEEIKKMEEEIKEIPDKGIQNNIRLCRTRDLSFNIYKKELQRQYNNKELDDANFDNLVDKNDIIIKTYDVLMGKMIDALLDGGWIRIGRRRGTGSGGLTESDFKEILYDNDPTN